MPELKLGTKHGCYNCGTKFYDLGKPEPVCPKCGANQKDAVSADSPASGSASRRRRKAEVVKPIDIEEEDAPIEPEIAEDELVEPDLADAELDDVEEEEEIDDDA